jgi:Ser/Thr protein kinase RdoA (MazF antagonist)
MQLHDLSGGGDVLERVGAVARRAVGAYDRGPEVTVELLNVSENATYRVDDPAVGPTVLRVHRLGYHTKEAIESELAWMDALRNEAGVRTPAVIPARDGSRVVAVDDPAIGGTRYCAMFEFLPGREPEEEDAASYEELGSLTARMHRHARTWKRPAGFTRFRWDADAAFGDEARWGRWQEGAGVGPAELEVLGRLEQTLRARLAAFGTGNDRFGLVHADTRLANLLVDDGRVSVIDFDDSGFSWYLYDLGTSVSFFEHRPHVPELIERWLAGYRTELPLPAEDEDEIWTFILFRRLLLVAWIGSHGAVDIAGELGAGYTAQSCELAERYLSRFG